jgi:hypothetical protein
LRWRNSVITLSHRRDSIRIRGPWLRLVWLRIPTTFLEIHLNVLPNRMKFLLDAGPASETAPMSRWNLPTLWLVDLARIWMCGSLPKEPPTSYATNTKVTPIRTVTEVTTNIRGNAKIRLYVLFSGLPRMQELGAEVDCSEVKSHT